MTDYASSLSARLRSRWLLVAVVAIIVIFGLYYPVGMLVVHKVDDNLDYQLAPGEVTPGGSRAVAMAASLIQREVDHNGWVANDPFFLPGSMLDNMPNYQLGMIHALGRFAFEMVDQIGRTRGSSQTDSDLQEAAGLLQYSGTKWIFDFSTSLLPTAKSEDQYRKARRALLNYDRRLAAGQAVFERRADNLLSTLDRISLDVGSASAAIDRQIHEGSGQWIDTQSDDVFYSVKGQAYAYYMLLRELREDYANIVRDRELGTAWDQMLASFAAASDLEPLIVYNGKPDAMVLPNHLASMGFYLLRARTQISEISNILLK
ncbi:MAG TPA: DUF2333 family protein [Ferrovibrio sp.]|uniref:DUF2333 family protein n=1 Tax=Ferrovibrio sp. TaxID=1917215 RepID=UPI002B4ABBD6|nr:DUF2333 family protein [Ferrovibrio sp.]HLT76884.1 DUF2333 family protein [Ferrovibrio sp.]